MARSQVRVDGDWVLYKKAELAGSLPRDLYLYELADVDLADRDAVAKLAELGTWRHWSGSPIGNYGDLGLHAEMQWLRTRAEASQLWGRTYVTDLETERNRLRREHHGFPIHVDEIALRVRVVQRLAHHAQAHATGEDVRVAWRACDTELDAWHQFTHRSNAALQAFHPRVYVDLGDPETNVGGAYPTVYEVAVLQIVNDLTEGATYRTCANEKCGRLFIRQRDSRAAEYERVGGLRYCSRRCANEQTQRDYRRRKREEKKG